MIRHPHHFKIAFALALSAGAWGIYWLPQRILVEGGLTGGWGTIAQMIIGFLILLPIAIWKLIKKKETLLLDARKPFEHKVGSFKKSVNPNISNFRDFPKYLKKLKIVIL